jgi:hypothetical protein
VVRLPIPVVVEKYNILTGVFLTTDALVKGDLRTMMAQAWTKKGVPYTVTRGYEQDDSTPGPLYAAQAPSAVPK